MEQMHSSEPPPAWANRSSLHQFLAQRGIDMQEDPELQPDMEIGYDAASSRETPFIVHQQENSPPTGEVSLPPGFLSTSITLPGIWTMPEEYHRYLCSIHTIQRRALVQSLTAECNVELYEVAGVENPDIIVDSHSGVLFKTLSDIPNDIDGLASEISELGYSFSRILVVLESFPADRALFSMAKWTNGQWPQLRMLTQTVSETCVKLKSKVNVKLGLLGIDDEDNSVTDECGEGLGDISVEFVLSQSIDESAQLVRVFGDYAAQAASPMEQAELGGVRLWLDRVVRCPPSLFLPHMSNRLCL